jgi:hypothetical protein
MHHPPRHRLPPLALLVCALACGADPDDDTDTAATTADEAEEGDDDDGAPTTAADATGTTAASDSDTASDDSTGAPLEHFSFFVTSLVAMQELSGNPEGFGGDLRYGEDGPGAGLRGADKICAEIAERSLPGAGQKPWRAFLSAVAGEDGQQVDAIDRIGAGPWYDRLGRLIAANRDDILTERPTGIDPIIEIDLPNEDGVPNHQPDPTMPEVDNHDTLTGTNENGTLYAADATCNDWTGATGTEGRPRVGHSWTRMMMMGPGGMGPGPAPNMGDGSPDNWMSALDESGCAPGVNLIEMGPPDPESDTVGSGGGYGGIYCFSLVP